MRLAAIIVVTWGLGILTVARTIGPLYVYRLRWTYLLGMLAMVFVAWAVWVAVTQLSMAWPRRLLGIPIAAAIVVFSVVNTTSAARTSTPQKPQSVTLTKLFPPLLKSLPRRDGAVIVTASTLASGGYASGIFLWLERLGIVARVPAGPAASQSPGKQRVYHGGPVRAKVTVADGSSYDSLAKDPTQRLVAYRGTLPPAERAAVAEQLAALEAQDRARNLSARELLLRGAARDRRLGSAVGVFLQTP